MRFYKNKCVSIIVVLMSFFIVTSCGSDRMTVELPVVGEEASEMMYQQEVLFYDETATYEVKDDVYFVDMTKDASEQIKEKYLLTGQELLNISTEYGILNSGSINSDYTEIDLDFASDGSVADEDIIGSGSILMTPIYITGVGFQAYDGYSQYTYEMTFNISINGEYKESITYNDEYLTNQ